MAGNKGNLIKRGVTSVKTPLFVMTLLSTLGSMTHAIEQDKSTKIEYVASVDDYIREAFENANRGADLIVESNPQKYKKVIAEQSSKPYWSKGDVLVLIDPGHIKDKKLCKALTYKDKETDKAVMARFPIFDR